jgi:hypothetical protein
MEIRNSEYGNINPVRMNDLPVTEAKQLKLE